MSEFEDHSKYDNEKEDDGKKYNTIGDPFFRGDSRPPSHVFVFGFTTINFHNKEKIPIFREHKDGNQNPLVPDISPGKLVCISRNFFACAIFPITKFKTSDTYIYVLDIDTKDCVLNTQKIQWGIADEMLTKEKNKTGNIKEETVKNAMWPMYTQEHAMREIKPENIICGVKVERSMNDFSFQTGGRFKVLGVVGNKKYIASHPECEKHYRRVIRNMHKLKDQLMSEKTFEKRYLNIPSQRDGYKASEPNDVLTGSHIGYGIPLPGPDSITARMRRGESS